MLILILTILFFIGTIVFGVLRSAFRTIQPSAPKKQSQQLRYLSPYSTLHQFFFPKYPYEGIFAAIIFTQSISRFCLMGSLFFLFLEMGWLNFTLIPYYVTVGFILLSLLLFFFITEFLPRSLGTRYADSSIRAFGSLGSLYLIVIFPLAYPFLKISQALSHTAFDYLFEQEGQLKKEIIALIKETEISGVVNPVDKKLIESAVTFRDRIAREVMVPRVDVFSLPAETSIKEAAKLLDREGYSRVPVYQNTVDNIVGILMYKDLIQKFMEYEESENQISILEAPIEKIVKNVLYTPETKKISNLLQEFRNKQMHFAVVVDEYGGTEGIVTIEDILEEIVGEIADEYDVEAELFAKLPNGSLIIDPKMTILDLEEELGIRIPQEGEFDTLGGYIYHRAGTIPPKGFVIEHDDFKIEILKSNERAVLKVKIIPLDEQEENISL